MRSAPTRTGPSRRRREKHCWRASPSATGRAGFTSSLFWMSPEDSEGFRPTTGSVKNYIALIGKKSPNLEEACGYYGEKIVLRAQQLGLNTCWVAMTYSKVKAAFQIAPGEKLCLVIAVGHGTTQGAGHPVKQPEEVSKADSPVPDWFQRGVRAALLAPTAMNQQKFTFTLQGGSVAAKAGTGFYTKVDLGIAKYHFEIGAGTAQFRWAP